MEKKPTCPFLAAEVKHRRQRSLTLALTADYCSLAGENSTFGSFSQDLIYLQLSQPGHGVGPMQNAAAAPSKMRVRSEKGKVSSGVEQLSAELAQMKSLLLNHCPDTGAEVGEKLVLPESEQCRCGRYLIGSISRSFP
ncbi:hypothetical protein JOB18_015294 [Solea senegalensis]|uniref:Uncharacterized protein n=1 Tax=Solea senegalensis TaxID=28829 RepID=A0AAV6QBG2_SOLSE|nr:hypothetical protein JOB18_015294 [Solea senegalensis]